MKGIQKGLFILICFVPVLSLSQSKLKNQNYFLSLRNYYGIIMPHHPEIQFVTDKRIHALELNFGVKTNGNQIWQQMHNYPNIGLGYLYTDLGNPDILGKSHSLFGFINGNLFRKKRYSLRYNFELGASYLTKSFDIQTNHLNFVIGTPFNIHANLLIENRYDISNQIQVFSGIGLYHFSNGGTKQPNLGINVANLSVGLKYFLNKETNELKETELPEYNKKFNFFLLLNTGGKGNDPAGVKSYLSTSFHFNAGRQLGYKYRLGAGTDFIFRNIKEADFDGSLPADSLNLDRYYCGIHISNDIIFGKLYFTVQQGIYVYPQNSLYNRFGFRYKIGKHFAVSTTLFTHVFNAKRIEVGLGCYF